MIFLFNSDYTLRLPPREVLDEYLKNPKYLYDRAPARPKSFFTQIMESIFNFIDWVLSSTVFGEHGSYYQLAALLLIVLSVLYILHKKMYLFASKSDFSQNNDSGVSLTIEEAALSDLDKLEEKYLSEGNYRGVIRVLYIKMLRKLADEKLLSLQNKKTNWEYAADLSGSRHHAKFIHATILFENSWYGGSEVSIDDLKSFKDIVSSGGEK